MMDRVITPAGIEQTLREARSSKRRHVGFVRETDELNNGAGCGPWLILLVSYIVVLTAIGISAIIIVSEVSR